MIPVKFDGADTEFVAPASWSRAQPCATLWVRHGDGHLESHWRPTLRERIKLLFGRDVVLYVAGTGQPPVQLEVE